jgi:hypothetical protein
MSTRPVPSPSVCSAFHLPPFTGGGEPLAWHTSHRFARIRVVAWTCFEHRVTWYELCTAGGLSFIRRTSGDADSPKVAQTHAWPYEHGRAVWDLLLTGRTL